MPTQVGISFFAEKVTYRITNPTNTKSQGTKLLALLSVHA